MTIARKFFILCIILGLSILIATSCSSSTDTSNIENIYESYWESDITTITKQFKINQTTFNLTEESNGLIKIYTSKEKAYVFSNHPAELLLNFYDDSLKLIGYRIYFQNDQDLYSFICERMEEYDQRYEIADNSSLLRSITDFSSFQRILDDHIKSDGVFTDNLNWNFDTSILLKLSVIKSNQNTESAVTISIQDITLVQDYLQLKN